MNQIEATKAHLIAGIFIITSTVWMTVQIIFLFFTANHANHSLYSIYDKIINSQNPCGFPCGTMFEEPGTGYAETKLQSPGSTRP